MKRKDIKVSLKKIVCIMANALRKAGLTLSAAFKKAWRQAREEMISTVAGTTFENRQDRLKYVQQFNREDLELSLIREPGNEYDPNAIAVILIVKPVKRYTVIGYVPKELAAVLAKVMDAGVKPCTELKSIIGGYSYKENLGLLMSIKL